MMRHVVPAMLFSVAALMSPPPSHAKDLPVRKILPKITRVSWLSLAVPNFVAATPGVDEAAAEITRSIGDVLARSGPYPFKQSDDLNAERVGLDNPPQFSFWKAHGVGLLLVGSVSEAADGRLEVGFRLWDTIAKRQMAGRRYFAPAELKERLALTLAAEVFEELDRSHEFALSRIEGR
ncbi:hypothetical protein V1291_002128 [Nitrobacteraceae bacterium AZCC 1564]